MRAYIVVDLGFGDSGKGLLTDFLVRQLDAGLVVRYNGGAQAGHNVVTPDGRHHTFSQFGSGTFIPHVKTFLSSHVVIHPTALLIEGDILVSKGVQDPFSRLRLSDQALMITPFHQAANRIREIVRGADRHGSCGVGVGEAVEDSLGHPENRVLAGDLHDPDLLGKKLRVIREQKREELTPLVKAGSLEDTLAREYEIFQRDDIIDTWVASIERIHELGLVVPDSTLERWLVESENVIFEGAQGVLLDGDAGFHPFTTWSRCSGINAIELIREMSPAASVFQIGVMRCYAVRHGPGPLPTETDSLNPLISEHNKNNQWQGTVRYGWFDAVLARYALGVTGKLDSLMVTHLDLLPHLKTWKYCSGYKIGSSLYDSVLGPSISGDTLTQLHLPDLLSLDQRTQITQALSAVTPGLETCEADEDMVIRTIEGLLGQQVGIVSRGPSADNVQMLQTLPL